MTTAKPSYLIKFCDTASAQKILNSESLRWSAPHLFNDPLEFHYQSDCDFTPQQLLAALTESALQVLFNNDQSHQSDSALMMALKRWREEERFEKTEDASAVLKKLLLPIAQQQQQQLRQFLEAWQKFSQEVRICSFAEKEDNLECWRHYADNHQGVALRFSATDKSLLHRPEAVHYRQQPLALSSLKEQLAIAYGDIKPPSTEIFFDLLLQKPLAQKREAEWRCFSREDLNNSFDADTSYVNKNFNNAQLEAIYFGLSTPKDQRQRLQQIVQNKYPQCKLFTAKLTAQSYTISFQPIN